MQDIESLAHVRWECKYHVVFIPKSRKKVIFGNLRVSIGQILRELRDQKGIGLLEGHATNDHVHLCLSIPPKYSVAYTIGFLKGKSAVRIHRELLQERRMTGLHFWRQDTGLARWVEMKVPCGNTSGSKKTGIVNKVNCLNNL